MSSVLLALAALSLVYAGWMRFLGRRAAAAALGRGAPGIRLAPTRVCEHTWAVAQRVAAPEYTKLATGFLVLAGLTLALGLAGLGDGVVLVTWLAVAVVMQVTVLSRAGRAAALAATGVRCEHQQPAPAPRPYRATRKARPRGGRGRGGKRR